MDCYIYYKSTTQHSEQVLAWVVQLHQHLSTQLSSALRLQQRPITGEFITWMEIYREIPPDFERIMAAALLRFPMQNWLIGERRMEYFNDVASN